MPSITAASSNIKIEDLKSTERYTNDKEFSVVDSQIAIVVQLKCNSIKSIRSGSCTFHCIIAALHYSIVA